MTASFTFREEVLLKYDQDIYELFCDFFDYLPLSCVVNGKFIAVHAGISPDLVTLNDINKINRFTGMSNKKFQRMGCFVICSGQIL
jgi:serine/threonine-protein phosphatase 2B catalytic subunit